MKKKDLLRLTFLLSLVVLILFGFQSESMAQQNRKVREARKAREKRAVVRKSVRHPKRTPHVRYVGLPKRKTVVVKLPPKAVVVKHAKRSYYVHKGVYYVKKPNGFVVVRPARGVRIHKLPIGYRKIVVRKKPYYYYYGEFYIESDGGYEIADPPQGAIVDAIPDGYETEEIDGEVYYVLDGVYFKEVETDEVEGGIGYQVVEME